MKRFSHELQTLASATNCTMFLLTTAPDVTSAPENSMVDGLMELRQHRYGVRNERRVVVHKLRGSDFLAGEHAYRISRDGVTVFPRLEALLATPTRRDPPPRTRVSSGVASLDALMLGGGFPAGSMTAVVGPTGSGKTTLSLQFLAGSSTAEPGLWFGCFEPPESLRLKAETLGFDLAEAEGRGEVEILWCPVGEHILDELGHRLLDAARRHGAKRLVIDGLTSFEQAALDPDRIVRFWSALANELRALGVTTLHTVELPQLVGPEISVPAGGLSALSEVMVVVRYVELRSCLFRLISLFKVRVGAFDPTIREFAINDDVGVVVGKPFEGVEAILSGLAREVARNAEVAPPPEGHDRRSPGGSGQTG
jgi:circadian clock protein KaiC